MLKFLHDNLDNLIDNGILETSSLEDNNSSQLRTYTFQLGITVHVIVNLHNTLLGMVENTARMLGKCLDIEPQFLSVNSRSAS